MTLIGRAVVDKKFEPKGLSILRRLSLLGPVSPDPISYSIGITTAIIGTFLTLPTFSSLFLALRDGLEHTFPSFGQVET